MTKATLAIDIERILETNPDGVSRAFIADILEYQVSPRALQMALGKLIEENKVVTTGQSRAFKYYPAQRVVAVSSEGALNVAETPDGDTSLSLSKSATEIQKLVSRPLKARKIVGYNRNFLESYRPNETSYFTDDNKAKLRAIGAVPIGSQPAGTFARKIMSRLLIDLSWNSSRLEGNTYTKLDTRQLIDFGKVAEGKDRSETQMILNHKDAIEFLVDAADMIAFDRRTILNLHALLSNNLLHDSQAEGRLRFMEVSIGQSVFQPLGVPQLIEENFEQVLSTASAIKDPFEQSLFVMVQLPYLQPFDDANKRVSRLAANIPLIKENLTPLTFLDVSDEIYVQAILAVYELNRVDLLKEVYIWAYRRSAERYAAAQQSLGQPDSFRLKHRELLSRVIHTVVQNAFERTTALKFIETQAGEFLPSSERERFTELSLNELLALHEGNFARYKIRPSEFERWQEGWVNKLK